MIIAPESSTHASELQTFEEANNLHSLTDYGAWRGMAASFSNGYHNNMTMTLASWLKKHSLADKDAPKVTQEEFAETHGPKLGLNYQPNESRAQLDWRIHQAAVLAKNNEYMTGQDRFLRNMAAGFAGGMLTDPLAMAPITLPSKAAKLAQLNVAAGRRTAASYHQATSTFKNVLAVNAAYEAPYALMMNDIGVQEYTFDHLKMAAAMNLGFAGLIGGGHGYLAGRAAMKNNHIVRQNNLLQKAFEDDDPRAALSTMLDSDNFVIKRILDENPELRDWARGESTTPLTQELDRLATQALYMHSLHLETKAASVAAARKLADRATKESASKLLGVQRRQSERLTNLLMFGKGAESITPLDRTLLKELGYQIEEFHQVHPEVKSIVPNVGFIPEPAKIVGNKIYDLVSKGGKHITKMREIEMIFEDSVSSGKPLGAARAAKLLGELREQKKLYEGAVKEVNQILGENFRQYMDDAQTVVNNIFYGKDEAVKLEKIPLDEKTISSKGITFAYALPRLENLITYVNEPFFYLSRSFREERLSGVEIADIYLRDSAAGGKFQNEAQSRAFISLFRTLMHEMVHHVEYIDPDSFSDIVAASVKAGGLIKGTRLHKQIYKAVRRMGYERGEKAAKEVPAIMVEFAIGQPAFWKTLKDKDPELYSRMADMIDWLAGSLYKTLVKHGGNPMFAKLSKTQDPDKLASEISKVFDNMRNSASSQAQLKAAMDKVAESEAFAQKIFDDADDAELSLMPDSKVQSKDLFEGNAKDQERYTSDPLGFIDRNVAALMGGDETVMPTLLELSVMPDVKYPIAVNEFIDRMEEKGYTWFDNMLVDELITNLRAARKRGRDVSKVILSKKEFKPILEEILKIPAKQLPLENAQRIGYILLDEKGGVSAQIKRITEYLEQEAHAAILRQIHDKVVGDSLNNLINSQKSAKGRIDQLKTFMDGSRRKGVTLGTSLQTYKTIQKQRDQNPLLDYLIENDLFDIFMGEDASHYMSSYVNSTLGNKELALIYGKELKEASILLHRDIMESLSTGEVPKKWQGVEALEGLIDVIRKTNKSQLGQMNQLGVSIRDRQGFLGYSMTYDRAYVKSMGYEAFAAKMMEMIDMKATAKAHGGLMAETPDSKSASLVNAGKHKKFNPQTFLRGLYEEIVNGSLVKDSDSLNPSMLGGYRKAAKIVFKPEHRIDALIEFGNRKNMGRFMLEQIAQRSESIALVKHVGHDSNKVLTNLIDNKGTFSDRYTAKATVDQVTGALDTPVDANLSSMFKNVRQVQNIAMLGGAGFSTLSDIPLVWTTLQYLGVGEEGMSAYFSRYKDAVSTQFKGDNEKMAQWFRAQGAAFDLITRNMAQRVVTDDFGVGGKISRANDFFFELNFLNRLTASHQQLFIDMLTSGLAEQLTAKKMNPVTKERLNEFGFTDKEISQLAKYVEETPDGVLRIGPSSITNKKLQEKLSGFMNQYMREGVIEPDVGAQALSRLGLQAGTMGGETARLALQYSSFMIAMGRVVYRRFLHGYSGDGKTAAFRNAHMYAYFGMALGAAYLATVLKDLSRFKEPMNPLDMTEQEWMRLVRQSGLLSYYEPFFNAAQFGSDAAFGPAVGTATDIASLEFGDAIAPYTGQYLPIVGPVIKQTAHVAHETIFNFLGDETEKADKAARQQLDSNNR